MTWPWDYTDDWNEKNRLFDEWFKGTKLNELYRTSNPRLHIPKE